MSWLKIAALISFICLVIAVLPSANAMKLPSEYESNQCELIAKDFQKEYGGSLVFIQPLKENGAYNLCDYCGHWVNKKYVSGNKKEFFFDWSSQRIFNSETELKNFWRDSTGKDIEIFKFDRERPPFAIIWHY